MPFESMDRVKLTPQAPLKLSDEKAGKVMRKFNEENERIKRRYAQHLKEARGRDQKSVEKAMAAILRFEESANFKPFKLFNIELAIKFKRKLEVAKNTRTGKPLSLATIDGTLRAVKGFVHWLAGQPGYKSRISYSDSDYFRVSAKDARTAYARRDAPHPTMEQVFHSFSQMPNRTIIEQRDKAMLAFLMMTGARDGAIVSLRLKHIDLVDDCVYQDARDVNTKNSKTFTTWFLPVDPAYRKCFETWVNTLRNEKLYGHEDALFPKPEMGLAQGRGFAVMGLSRDVYANTTKFRNVIKQAFKNAGLPPFAPHSFRKTLMKYGDQICLTREQFKAWSLNIGHDSVVISILSYMPIPLERQKELIKKMSA